MLQKLHGVEHRRLVCCPRHCRSRFDFTENKPVYGSKSGIVTKLKYLFNPFPHNDTLGNKPFENTVGKGEIARNEQFLLFPQCFLPLRITCCHFHQI